MDSPIVLAIFQRFIIKGALKKLLQLVSLHVTISARGPVSAGRIASEAACACQSKQWERVCFQRPHVGDFYNLKSISSEQRLNLDLRNQLFSEITNIMRSIGLFCVKILKLCQVGLSGAGSHTITHFTATKPGE